ncbi:hypothetical protein Scep_020913 [Stephania cephalantha]|uniref:Uncharacterized protein n=1 Tax=Stephania cephalantha TaxID=152367 RepID=A0AAP0I1E7_9MAGN
MHELDRVVTHLTTIHHCQPQNSASQHTNITKNAQTFLYQSKVANLPYILPTYNYTYTRLQARMYHESTFRAENNIRTKGIQNQRNNCGERTNPSTSSSTNEILRRGAREFAERELEDEVAEEIEVVRGVKNSDSEDDDDDDSDCKVFVKKKGE